MRVVVSDVEQDQAERVANAVRELGGEAIGVRCDVSDAGSVEELAERAYEAYGAVHLLCSNAGVLMDAPLLVSANFGDNLCMGNSKNAPGHFWLPAGPGQCFDPRRFQTLKVAT